MTYDYYDIYFDPADLVVDTDGHLENPDALQIIRFVYGQVTDELISSSRVNSKGEIIENPWKDQERADDLTHLAENDFVTIDEAMGAFEGWLNDHLDWRESWRGDYYNPPEYICAGIEGYVDDEPRYHRLSHRWY